MTEGKEKDLLEEAEETERAVLEFEKVQMGLEGARLKLAPSQVDEQTQPQKGTKREFELDEDELLRVAANERKKMRTALDEEKVRFSLPLQEVGLTGCPETGTKTSPILLGAIRDTKH